MIQAGFGRLDMTPPLGTPLAGYYSARFAKGVLDPLELNALALSDGEKTTVMITADVLGIRRAYADEIRALVAERVQIPAECVMIAALHQHTSMRLADAWERSALTDKTYLDLLYRKFGDVAKIAIDDLSDAVVSRAAAETAVQIAFIRRYRMKNGSVKTNPGAKRRDEVEGPIGEPDNTVRLVRFVREGKKDIALVNFSTHPDVIGGERISADWPGFVRRMTEADHPDAHCICLNGAQGDSNHVDLWAEKPLGGYDHSAFMGRTIVDAANTVWEKTTPCKEGKLYSDLRLVWNLTSTKGLEHYEECRDLYYKYWAGDRSVTKTASGIDIGECGRIVKLVEREGVFQCVPVNVLGFGDLAFVGYGGEPFTHYATAARESAPDKFVICACCANAYEDYLPTDSAFDEGGYEATSTSFTKGLEADCVSAAAEMLKEF